MCTRINNTVSLRKILYTARLLLPIFLILSFSAQTIKIQSLAPLPDEDEKKTEESVPKEKSFMSDESDSSKEASESAKKDSPKKGKVSLKDIKPEKEGSMLVNMPTAHQENTDSMIKPSNAKKLDQLPNNARQQGEKQTSLDDEKYAKQRNVHLKNYNPDDESNLISWKLKKTAHFKLFYEKGTEGIMNAISMHLESSLQSMKLKFPVFPYWIGKESSNIYLYATKNSYLNGEFKPMAWSEGIALPEKKIVAVYMNPDLISLKATLTHELSHLYLRSFFAEKDNAEPPLWLDEGIANFMGNTVYKDGGPWEKSMMSYPNVKTFSMPEYFNSGLKGLSDENITYWYLQAYTIISFLSETKGNVHLKTFCTKMREGQKETTLLWNVYGYRNIEDFQNKMYTWLDQKTGNKKSSIFSEFSTGRSDSGISSKPAVNKMTTGFTKR